MIRLARRGFSLIEMMIAVLVSSVVIAGLYSIFNLQSMQFLYQKTPKQQQLAGIMRQDEERD